MTIPEVRERLYELADELHQPELKQLADELRRHYHGHRAPAISRHLDKDLSVQIREYVREHPDETMHLVGVHFKVNQGRVSEALFGKRPKTVPHG